MIVYAPANKGSEEAVLESIQKEITRLVSAPIKYGDLRSARNAVIGITEIKRQNREVQIKDIVGNILAGKGIDGFNNYEINLQEVKIEDFIEAARRIFKMDKAVIVRAQGKSK